MTSASTYSEIEESKPVEFDPQRWATINSHLEALNALPAAKPLNLDEKCLFHGQKGEEDNVDVVLSQVAIKHIAAHSYSNVQCEVGGALLGKAYRNDGRFIVNVQAAIPAVTADQGPVHFTFTADAWSQLQRDRLSEYPDLDIVGWFHTHPDLGVFYSSDDVVVHSAAFTQPWHVGMVIDPLRKETSFFGWIDGQLEAKKGFYENPDLQPYSLLEWQAVQTGVWDHPYEELDAEEPASSTVYLHPSNRPMLPMLKPYIGIGIGIFGLLLSVFLLFAWVLPLTRQVDQLQTMTLVLADSALAESNAATCPDARLRILMPLSGQNIQAGTIAEVMGTTMIEDAVRYQVNVRAQGADNWVLLNASRRDSKLGQLASWDTSSTPPGIYEIRLTAVDNNNIRLPGSPPCSIAVELTP